jgi:hypothetical protein
LEIEFQPDSAEVQCGNAVLAMPYQVEREENQLVVNIEDAASPVALTLGADGRLNGSGQIQVHGRRGSASCALGVLAASEAGGGSIAAAKSSAAPTKTGVTPSPTPPAGAKTTAGPAGSAAGPAAAVPNAVTRNAVLAIAAKFELPAGAPNPIAGHSFVLLRDDYATALSKGGFQVPAGLTPAKATALACANRSPDCQKAGDAINTDMAAGVRMDANGKATFPGVAEGSYFLIGSVRYNNQFIYWDLPVELKNGANFITLGPGNAKPADR